MDKSTGKKQQVTIQSSGGLSDAEVEKMVRDAESKRDEDEKKKEGVKAKIDAETLSTHSSDRFGRRRVGRKDATVATSICRTSFLKSKNTISTRFSSRIVDTSLFEEVFIIDSMLFFLSREYR